MTGTPESGGKVANEWDAYWKNRQQASVHMQNGIQDVALQRFWSRLFGEAFASTPVAPKILDIGCGAGAVTQLALTVARQHKPDAKLSICGVDHSSVALAELRKFSPQVDCVVADAARIPFQNQAFDLVTSQFGMEYAGVAAPAEAARLLRPGGQLAVALHVRGGGIYEECEVNRKALSTVRECNLLGCFRQVFETVSGARQDAGGRSLFYAAARKFAEAVKRIEEVLRRWGQGVATGLVYRLYTDTVRMYRRLHAYELREVASWVDFMTREIDNYLGRMRSMLNAALSQPQMDRLSAQLQQQGLSIQRRCLLGAGSRSKPIAWILTAIKSVSSEGCGTGNDPDFLRCA